MNEAFTWAGPDMVVYVVSGRLIYGINVILIFSEAGTSG